MEKKESLDKIIHKLKEIQTNSEDAIRSADNMSWTDVMFWVSKEIRKNRDLGNNLGDIVRELEEYKKEHSIEELIKMEYKNRKMALALENKVEYYRSKADMYLGMLLGIDSYEQED